MATETTEHTDPNPTPKTLSSLHPQTFLGERRGNTTSGAGLRGSVLSVAHLEWGGRVENRPFNHLPRNSRKNLISWALVFQPDGVAVSACSL
jgi:hypothetical protein